MRREKWGAWKKKKMFFKIDNNFFFYKDKLVQ